MSGIVPFWKGVPNGKRWVRQIPQWAIARRMRKVLGDKAARALAYE